MSFVDVNGQAVEVDEDGFIVDPELWNERDRRRPSPSWKTWPS